MGKAIGGINMEKSNNKETSKGVYHITKVTLIWERKRERIKDDIYTSDLESQRNTFIKNYACKDVHFDYEETKLL